MMPDPLPSKCQRILEKIKTRQEPHISGGWSQLQIDERCTLHLFVLRDDYERAANKPNQVVFSNKELSVFVEGGDFDSVDVQVELNLMRERTQKDFVGVATLKAKDILENNHDFKFVLVHDPHPFNDDRGRRIEPPKNHALIVCDKDPTGKRTKLMELSGWSLHPDDFKG